MMWLGRAALAATLVSCSFAAHAAAIRFNVEAGDVIGSKSVGLICFPATSLRWDRAFRPDSEEVDEILVATFGEALSGRVRAEVVRLKMKLCQPHWGMLAKMVGDPTALKGRIELDVKWSIVPGGCDAHIDPAPLQTSFAVAPNMKGGIAGVLRAALKANAAEAAKAIEVSSACRSEPKAKLASELQPA